MHDSTSRPGGAIGDVAHSFALGESWAFARKRTEEPHRHFAMVGKGQWQSALIARDPLTEQQIQSIVEAYEDRVAYIPGGTSNDRIHAGFFQAVQAGNELDMMANQPLNDFPVEDDRPFFYEYEWDLLNSESGEVLLRILGWVSAIAAVLILLPLLATRAVRAAGTRLIGVLGYFTCIGAGFMFVEVVLIQKLVLFLGHPSYSITVTLFSVLIFSGLGSMFSTRFATNRSGVAWVWGVILLAILFYGLGLGQLLPAFHSGSLFARAALVTAALAPGSFFMGMPFPLMIRLLEKHQESALIPWAWAINAFTSVAASVLTVMFAMQVGFGAVLYLGAAFYLGALVFYVLRSRVAV